VSEANATVKNVFFDLPYLIYVKDSMNDPLLRAWAESFRQGIRPLPYSPYAPQSERPGAFIVGAGLPVYLPPDQLAECYLVSLETLEVGIRFLRRVNPHGSSVLMGEVPGDRAGRASFSSVKVMFDARAFEPEQLWDMELFVNLAVEAVNKLLSHYRIISDRPYVQPVTPQVIQKFHLQTQFENGTPQIPEYGAGNGPLRGFGGAIPDSQDLALREAVASDLPPSIYATLDADVRDHLDLRRWRLATIEAAVLFEAWLSSFLRERYARQGLVASQIDAKFLGPDGRPVSVSRMAKSLVRDATLYDFATTQHCQDWELQVRNLRNDLVHGKRFDVSPTEAVEAYKTVLKCIALLETV
jgi:hypothetical protein